MTIDQAIAKAYLLGTGKTASISTGNTSYDRLYALADVLQKDWQNEPGTDWMSLYNVVNIGKVTQGNDTYDSDSSIRKVSARENDSVILTAVNGNEWFYDIITPDKLTQYRDRQAVAQYQGSFKFASGPTSPIFPANDARIGASITIPYFGFVDDVTSGKQTVQVDDPNWLCYMMAAEYVRTDLVRQNQYGNLLARGNELMQTMKDNNEDQLQEVPIDMDFFDIDPNTGTSVAWY